MAAGWPIQLAPAGIIQQLTGGLPPDLLTAFEVGSPIETLNREAIMKILVATLVAAVSMYPAAFAQDKSKR